MNTERFAFGGLRSYMRRKVAHQQHARCNPALPARLLLSALLADRETERGLPMAYQSFLLRLLVVACVCSLLPTAFRPAYLTTNNVDFRHKRRAFSPAPHSTQPKTAISSPHRALSPSHDRSDRRRPSRSAELSAGASGASDRGEFLKHVTLGGFLSLATVGGTPNKARAFCGEPYPYWAYYVDFDEVLVPFEFEGYSGKVFARTVGNAKDQKKVRLITPCCYDTMCLAHVGV